MYMNPYSYTYMNYMHIYTSGLYPSTFADLHFSYKKLSFVMAIDFFFVLFFGVNSCFSNAWISDFLLCYVISSSEM